MNYSTTNSSGTSSVAPGVGHFLLFPSPHGRGFVAFCALLKLIPTYIPGWGESGLLWLVHKNHVPYLWDLSKCFFQQLHPVDFYSCEGFHQVIYQKEWSIKLRIDNGGWLEPLNLPHVSGCEMLHFVTSYMKQNKSRKQTLESAQYGLEISFKLQNSDQNSCLSWVSLIEF